MDEIVFKRTCRVCKSTLLTKVLTLGPTPLANAFLTSKQINQGEKFYPLDVYYCTKCSFIQLGHVVNPSLLFDNYVYVSSTSKVFQEHFKKFAEHVYRKLGLNTTSLVIDIGSNDGILLKPFKKMGVNVLGIEPAAHIAKLAEKQKIKTIAKYFNETLAKAIVKKYGKTDVITATNVFAHIDNLDEVIKGIIVLLKNDGVFIIEAPYLIDFLEKNYFDLVYHEHLSYFAVHSLQRLFARHHMVVFAVEKVAVHGGTIRVYVKKESGKFPVEKSVKMFLTKEEKHGLKQIKTYKEYAKQVYANKVKLLTLLRKLKAENKTIAAYGAPAKGNTLLNFFSIGQETLDFVVDDSTFKQGLYTPGKHLPVVPSKNLYTKKPDYVLILAWNFADSIIKMHKNYKKDGKFIIPVPKPKIAS